MHLNFKKQKWIINLCTQNLTISIIFKTQISWYVSIVYLTEHLIGLGSFFLMLYLNLPNGGAACEGRNTIDLPIITIFHIVRQITVIICGLVFEVNRIKWEVQPWSLDKNYTIWRRVVSCRILWILLCSLIRHHKFLSKIKGWTSYLTLFMGMPHCPTISHYLGDAFSTRNPI